MYKIIKIIYKYQILKDLFIFRWVLRLLPGLDYCK